jgi:hypothetical protein
MPTVATRERVQLHSWLRGRAPLERMRDLHLTCCGGAIASQRPQRTAM